MRYQSLGIIISVIIGSSALFARPQTSDSLGDLARKAREAREKNADAAATFNNDSNRPEKPPAPSDAPPPADPPLPYALKTIPKYWPSCEAAKAEITTTDDAAHTDQHFAVSYSGRTLESNGVWTFTGTTTVKGAITVTLPDWVSIPNGPVRAAWQNMLDALRKHEEGHVHIAMEEAPQLNKTLTGTGPTESAAKEDARRQFNQMMQTVDSATQARQNQYDALTDHGRKQSAAGGTDVRLVCP